MLEAKIVEVALSDGSQTGVNWAAFTSAATTGRRHRPDHAPGTTLAPAAPSPAVR